MLKNLPQVDATWSYMLLKMTNFWHTIAQIFMFKPVLLHYTKLLAENLLYKLCFSNFSQKCLLRVEKHAFVKVKLREILVKWFDGKKSPWSLFTVLFHTHTVLTINKFFRQIEAIIAFLASKLTLQKAHFWEKLIVPTHSYKGVENEFCPKFSKLWCKNVFGRGDARIWVQLAISYNPMLKKFPQFKEISQFDQLWSPLMRFLLDF